MAKSDEERPIIVVKKIKKGGHGHHGGAWKIAYADFVTAMMAFFLLMWLRVTKRSSACSICTSDAFAVSNIDLASWRTSSGSRCLRIVAA